MLFDGGSLVLYMCGLVVYVANIVKGLRIVTQGTYGRGLGSLNVDELDGVDSAGYDEDTKESVLGREDNLKVLSASHTILALVLVGVLILQAGQWYAERADERERVKMREEEERSLAEEGEEGATGAGAGLVGRKAAQREAKKSK
jgi:ER membrane protein SH3